ncbi:glycosyltransferase family 2 protein [Carnobacterium funditum]|uniref:glycosyltransferase family 2 protein n=1 Tax=Carnobacterium funditum TaxID=2752 RepID=UPI00068CFDB5|nr:glycosyltransferase family 2 protein [Carnobacterium funditum]
MRQPKISIIIPVYNTEKYLNTCLNSVLNQTFTDIEVICVDDGSPDNSIDLLEMFAKKDERVIVVSQQNTGLSDARNNALAYVTGDYVMYVDSDDWIELNTCEIAYRVALEEKADVILWSYIREFTNHSLPKKIFKKRKEVLNQQESASKLHRRMVGSIGKELKHPENADAIVTAWGKLYKTEIIKYNEINYMNTKIVGTEDALFNIDYFGYVKKAVCLEDALYHYRKDNEVSLTSLYKERLFMQNQMKYDLIEMYIAEHSLGDDYKKALTNRIALSLLELGLNTVESHKGLAKKITELKEIISQDRYKKAYQQMDFNYLPIHWKLFYGCAKLNFASGIYALLWSISKLRDKNKIEDKKESENIKIQTEVQ